MAAGAVSVQPHDVVIGAAEPTDAASSPIVSQSRCGSAAPAKNTSRSRAKNAAARSRSRSRNGSSAA